MSSYSQYSFYVRYKHAQNTRKTHITLKEKHIQTNYLTYTYSTVKKQQYRRKVSYFKSGARPTLVKNHRLTVRLAGHKLYSAKAMVHAYKNYTKILRLTHSLIDDISLPQHANALRNHTKSYQK